MKKFLVFLVISAIALAVMPVSAQLVPWDGGRVATFTATDSTLMKRFYFLAPSGVATDTILVSFSQYSADGTASCKLWAKPFMLRPGSTRLNSTNCRTPGGVDSLTLQSTATTTESAMLQYRAHVMAKDSLENDQAGAITTPYRPEGYIVDVIGQSGNRADNEIWVKVSSYKNKFLKDL